MFQKVSDIEKFCGKEGERRRKGVSRFSVNFFLSHSAENYRRGTLHCVTDFGYRKMLGINRKYIWHDRNSNLEPTA